MPTEYSTEDSLARLCNRQSIILAKQSEKIERLLVAAKKAQALIECLPTTDIHGRPAKYTEEVWDDLRIAITQAEIKPQ